VTAGTFAALGGHDDVLQFVLRRRFGGRRGWRGLRESRRVHASKNASGKQQTSNATTHIPSSIRHPPPFAGT